MIYAACMIMLLAGLLGFSLIYNRFFEKSKYFLPCQIGFFAVSAGIIIPFYFNLVEVKSYSWVIAWAAVFIVLWLQQKVAYKQSLSVSFFEAVWSVLSWLLVVELELIIIGVRGLKYENLEGTDIDLLSLFLIYGVILVSYSGVYYHVSYGVNKDLPKKLGPRQSLLTVLIFALFELISITYRWPFNILIEDKWHQIFLAQVAEIIILYLGCELFKSSAMRKELDLLQMLWTTHEEQYHLAKTNIDLINQKCHDLKHQVRALRYVSEEEREQYLTEIEESIDIYEHIVLTGNDALDTILTEKSLYCRKHNINVSCVADGVKLAFINPIDLYAIFGNAIDNAIEAVKRIEDFDRRTIDVIVYTKDNFLIINIINPMVDELRYDESEKGNRDALPVSTKLDNNYHGFGLKSIKYVVEKYNGYTSISTEDNCFSLKILIPINTTYDK